MSDPLPDQAAQTVAVLAACFAQALCEKDPDFIPVFEGKLKEMYSRI